MDISKLVVPGRSLEDCFTAGKDCAINGANDDNCHYSIFSLQENTAEWESGKIQWELPPDERNLGQSMIKAKVIIFDMDGTLSNCDHRKHFVSGEVRDFDAFYDAMGRDTRNDFIADLCNMYWHKGGNFILICTGRPEAYRDMTEYWLKTENIYYDRLIMRRNNLRKCADYLVKQEMLMEILQQYDVVAAFDDRNQAVDMWRRNGITCLQVADGDF